MKLNQFIAEKGKHTSADAGEHLFRQGDLNDKFYVLKSGLLKAYYLSADGKESIKSFIFPGNSIGSLTALHSKAACSFSLICLEPCELTVLPFQLLYDASQTDPEISANLVDFLLRYGMKKEMREFELLCLTAEDRYRKLLETMPEMFQSVTQNEIARYLGVTPVGLSRIKKRVG